MEVIARHQVERGVPAVTLEQLQEKSRAISRDGGTPSQRVELVLQAVQLAQQDRTFSRPLYKRLAARCILEQQLSSMGYEGTVGNVQTWVGQQTGWVDWQGVRELGYAELHGLRRHTAVLSPVLDMGGCMVDGNWALASFNSYVAARQIGTALVTGGGSIPAETIASWGMTMGIDGTKQGLTAIGLDGAASYVDTAVTCFAVLGIVRGGVRKTLLIAKPGGANQSWWNWLKTQ